MIKKILAFYIEEHQGYTSYARNLEWTLNIPTLAEELIVVNKIICFTDNQRLSRTWRDESSDSQWKHLGTIPPPSC